MPAPPPSTLDPAEIEKFGALAAQWWNPDGPFGALHRLNPIRLQYIRDLFPPPPPAASRPAILDRPKSQSDFGRGEVAKRSEREGVSPPAASASPLSHAARDSSPLKDGGAKSKRKPLAGVDALDLGCGGGLVSAPLARMGARVTAIDAAEEAIGAARAYAVQAGLEIDFRCTSAEALAATGVRYDLVTALEIIEHVSDVGAFLNAATALLKPGGLLVLSTINRTAKARAFAIVGAERILKWAPEGAHDYDKLVTPEEIRAGAPEIAWQAPMGISYQPLGRGWTLSHDLSINYLMAGRRR